MIENDKDDDDYKNDNENENKTKWVLSLNSVHCKHIFYDYFLFFIIKIKLLFQYAWVLFNILSLKYICIYILIYIEKPFDS